MAHVVNHWQKILGKSTVHMTTDEIMQLTREDKKSSDTALLNALEDNDLAAIAKASEDQYEQAVEVKWDDL